MHFKRWNVRLTLENIGAVTALFDAIRTDYSLTLYMEILTLGKRR